MKTILAVLFASTALSAGAAIPTPGDAGAQGNAAAIAAAAAGPSAAQGVLLLAERDEDHEGGWFRRLFDDDDDDRRGRHGDDDECDDDDEGGNCRGGMNPAPAGTVAPPANGLFNSGAAPKAQVN
jgi:hypothetical protein